MNKQAITTVLSKSIDLLNSDKLDRLSYLKLRKAARQAEALINHRNPADPISKELEADIIKLFDEGKQVATINAYTEVSETIIKSVLIKAGRTQELVESLKEDYDHVAPWLRARYDALKNQFGSKQFTLEQATQVIGGERASINTTMSELRKRGLVNAVADPVDARRRYYTTVL